MALFDLDDIARGLFRLMAGVLMFFSVAVWYALNFSSHFQPNTRAELIEYAIGLVVLTIVAIGLFYLHKWAALIHSLFMLYVGIQPFRDPSSSGVIPWAILCAVPTVLTILCWRRLVWWGRPASAEQSKVEQSSKTARLCSVDIIALAVIAAILVLIFAPFRINTHEGQRQNQAAAVAMLRRLNELQQNHSVERPSQGLACNFVELWLEDRDQNRLTDSRGFGVYSGYKFQLTDCNTDTNGRVTTYKLTGVPIQPGMSGFWAVCTDESGAIWFDKNGSAEACLRDKRSLLER